MKEEFSLLKDWNNKRERLRKQTDNKLEIIKKLEDRVDELRKAFINLEKNIAETKNKNYNSIQLNSKFELFLSQIIEKKCEACIQYQLPDIESKLEKIQFHSVSSDFLKNALEYLNKNPRNR